MNTDDTIQDYLRRDMGEFWGRVQTRKNQHVEPVRQSPQVTSTLTVLENTPIAQQPPDQQFPVP